MLMSRWIRIVGVLVVAVIAAAGCADVSQNPKTALGAAGGAAAGGLIAAAASGNPAAIAGGVILGGLAGGAIGNALDQRDHQLAAQAAQQALEVAPVGSPVPWTNPDNGHTGTVTPVRTYQVASGGYCREYQQIVTVGGQQQQSYGTACRQPDGSWKVVN
jgi:surface antigen